MCDKKEPDYLSQNGRYCKENKCVTCQCETVGKCVGPKKKEE